MAGSVIKRLLIGPPLATSQLIHERVTKFKGLAVFSSDALSSTAYATEEILIVLVAGGAATMSLALPIAAVIVTVLAILTFSYFQTIHAYPSGGGAYIVAHDNLGRWPGLVAAAALLIDYVLTVSVSISSGVAAITSAVPTLAPSKVTLAVLAIALVATLNLRGVRESATIFAVPTYVFIFSIAGLIIAGLWRAAGQPPVPPAIPAEPISALQPVGLYMILRAFASGSTAMTGVEAISNGIPAFRPPESRNAGITLIWMAVILGSLFLGITLLAQRFSIVPNEHETVVSQIARLVLGAGPAYYVVQAATALILILAANTSFADFPRLSSILARDGFLPRQLANLGDRLVFANGIVALGVLSSLLVMLFHASVHALIPLYAVGVFISFTLSQSGMVVHWWRLREPGWRRHMLINGIGAVATAVVLGVVLHAKLLLGAWIVVVVIPVFIGVMYKIRHHYEEVRRELSLEYAVPAPPITRHKVVVPVAGIHRGVLVALRYAKSLGPDVEAIIVDVDPTRTQETREKWDRWGLGVPLRVLPSPYRSMVDPITRYLDAVEHETGFDDPITIVVPEFVPEKFWQFFLHGQTALLLKLALYFRRRHGHRTAVVTSVPYYFGKPQALGQVDVERPATLLQPVATVGALLLGVLVALVVAVTHAWPAIVEQVLGGVAVLLTAALFFLLLLRSIFT
ncbi:MAG: APC family permease [Armatimonadota bacterium]|nr:APC family permease [Armatimonadota bacterium]